MALCWLRWPSVAAVAAEDAKPAAWADQGSSAAIDARLDAAELTVRMIAARAEGRYEERRDLAQRVLVLKELAFGAQSVEAGVARIELGDANVEYGDLKEARAGYRAALSVLQAVERFEERREQANEALVNAFVGLGLLELAVNNVEAAKTAAQDALQRVGTKSTSFDLGQLMAHLRVAGGEAELALGMYDVRLRGTAAHSAPVLTALLLSDKAVALAALERGNEARASCEVAVDLARKEGAEGAPRRSQVLDTCAQVYALTGRFDLARTLYQEALSGLLGSLPPGHPSIASARHELGALLRILGEYEAAQELLEAALERRRAALFSTAPALADTLLELGQLATAQGNLRAAMSYLGAAFSKASCDTAPVIQARAMAHYYLIARYSADDVAGNMASARACLSKRAGVQSENFLLDVASAQFGTPSGSPRLTSVMSSTEQLWPTERLEILIANAPLQGPDDEWQAELDYIEKYFGAENPAVATLLSDWAATLQGSHPDDAIAKYQRAIDIQRKVASPTPLPQLAVNLRALLRLWSDAPAEFASEAEKIETATRDFGYFAPAFWRARPSVTTSPGMDRNTPSCLCAAPLLRRDADAALPALGLGVLIALRRCFACRK